MKEITKILTSLLLSISLLFVVISSAQAQVFHPTDGSYNIFVGNNPSTGSGFVDPVSGSIGQRIQARVTAWNTQADTTAQYTKVRVEIPSTAGTTFTLVTHIWADNVSEITDSLTINVGTNSQLVYVPGHAAVFMPGCINGCPLTDSALTGSGVTIGGISSGGSNSAQVTFKVDIVPVSTPTPNPTPTPPGATSSCVSLSSSPTEGTAPLLVRFSGAGFDSAGSIGQYEFNFGDASGGQPQVWSQATTDAAHRYENPGTYTATLKVKDSRGNWLESADCRKTITVHAPPVVLAAETPKVLPKTGASALFPLVLSTLAAVGIYLYRRFKLA